MPDIPFYIQNWNPEALHLAGPLAVRWYGLAYLGGLVAGWLLLRRFSRKGWFAIPAPETQAYTVYLVLFGVFLGGRLGYLVFYNLSEFIQDPTLLFRIWEGGMASHGGVIGVTLYMLWVARRRRIPVWNLSDNTVCVVPAGLALGRFANFVNGELWGRVTEVPWAVVFPREAVLAPGSPLSGEPPYPLESIRIAWHLELLQPRHPSQLYQMVGEGLWLLALLLILRHTRWSRARPGRLTWVFLLGYAVVRILAEFFREPDPGIPLWFGWMTRGQALSLLMVVGAAVVAWWPKGEGKEGRR